MKTKLLELYHSNGLDLNHRMCVLDLGDNQNTDISNNLCHKDGWQDWNTVRYECDAILCPPNNHNEYGRQSPSDPCVECTESCGTYMGSTKCGEVNQLTDRIIIG